MEELQACCKANFFPLYSGTTGINRRALMTYFSTSLLSSLTLSCHLPATTVARLLQDPIFLQCTIFCPLLVFLPPFAPVTSYSETPPHLFSGFCGSCLPATLLSPAFISETLSPQAQTTRRATSLLLTPSFHRRLKSWSASLTLFMNTWLPLQTPCSKGTAFNLFNPPCFFRTMLQSCLSPGP